ncbi:MAG: class I SAM-dependent methyltransferase family protein [Candidatus Ancaeobacter aquaticus]|nr:class I SAM-dependent methyltransferase family protein [Candidatus Ancaeobacter aquaticus]
MTTKIVDGIEYEVITPLQSIIKKIVLNPFINYILPRAWILHTIENSKCDLLKESVARPGGWRSMEISYENGQYKDFLDMVALRHSIFPMGLRNRKKLFSKVIAELIKRYAPDGHVNILGIGAGSGANVMSGMVLSETENVSAFLIDLDSDAFEYGKNLCKSLGLSDGAVSFIQGDAIDVKTHIQVSPQIVKLIGIIEYLSDAHVESLMKVAYGALVDGGSIVTHSISDKHGVDPFARRIFNLQLRYRTVDEVCALLKKAGFSNFKVQHEPLGIYSLISAEKGK